MLGIQGRVEARGFLQGLLQAENRLKIEKRTFLRCRLPPLESGSESTGELSSVASRGKQQEAAVEPSEI